MNNLSPKLLTIIFASVGIALLISVFPLEVARDERLPAGMIVSSSGPVPARRGVIIADSMTVGVEDTVGSNNRNRSFTSQALRVEPSIDREVILDVESDLGGSLASSAVGVSLGVDEIAKSMGVNSKVGIVGDRLNVEALEDVYSYAAPVHIGEVLAVD